MVIVLVAVAGAGGVLARYGLTVWVQSLWTVAGINIAGSFLLGLVVHLGAGWDRSIRDVVGVGFIGGFTTLSTLTTQTVLEIDGGRPGRAFAYLAVNIVGGLVAACTGYLLGRALT